MELIKRGLLNKIKADGDLCTYPEVLRHLEETGIPITGDLSLCGLVEGIEVMYWAGMSSSAMSLLEAMINDRMIFQYPVERALYEAREEWIDHPCWNPVMISTAPALSLAEFMQKQIDHAKKYLEE